MVEGFNKFWHTPFRITKRKVFSLFSEELISIVKQLEEVETKEVESIEIAGLDQGLTTKWYTYNFLSVENKAVAQLSEFIKSEVRNYMQGLCHEEGYLYLQSWANLSKNKEILKIHSLAGPYSYVTSVFFVKTVASSTRYFSPLDRRIPSVENFYETEIEVRNVEGGLVIFSSFIEHSSTSTLKKLKRVTVAFNVMKEALIGHFHNGFGYKVIDAF